MIVEHNRDTRLEIGEIDLSPSKGRIDVIDGCMSSGKSRELIRRINVITHSINARIASGLEEPGVTVKDQIVIFKPAIDNRRGEDTVNSRDGDRASALSVQTIEEAVVYINDHPKVKVLAIDEAQFFNGKELIVACKYFADIKDIRVIVAGLGKDFKGDNWGGVLELGSIADEHIHLTAACAICGGQAEMTQRLILDIENNVWLPAHINDPVELVGEQQYQARCRKHHQLRTD